MKALAYFKPKVLKFIDLDKPAIKPNEILLKMKKVGICGTDLHIYHGGMNVPTPLIIGHEFVGEIVEVGSEVTGLKVGDKAVAEHVVGCGVCVYCQQGRKNICVKPTVYGVDRPGALAEYMAIPASLVYVLPETMTYDQGVLVEPLSIAVYAVRLSDVSVGDQVAVIGQGPIGLFVDQVAMAAGARVYGLDVVDSRLEYAKQQKYVNNVINSKSETTVDQLKNLTQQDGVDVVFEAVGIEPTAQLAIETARKGGQVIMLGVFEKPVTVDLMKVVRRELMLKGSWTCLHSFPATIDLIATGKVSTDSIISHHYTFDNAIQAFEESSGTKEGRIKTVIEFE